MIGRPEAPDETHPSQLRAFDDYELRLGDIMRGERATLGKSLLDVQRELKIKATYIAAIENSDPTAFETPGFIAGYVRSYARYLNLDPEWAYRTFCEEGDFTTAHGMSAAASGTRPGGDGKAAQRTARQGPRDPFVDPNVSFVPKGEAVLSGIQPAAIGSLAVLIALIGGIGYGGWAVLREVQKVQFAPVDQTPGVVSQVDPLAPTGSVASAVEEVAGVETPSTEAFDRLYRPQALDVPVMVPRDGPIATLDPSTFGSFIPDPRARGETSAPPTTPGTRVSLLVEPDSEPAPEPAVQVVADVVPEVVLFAVRPSWVRVRGADGTVIFEKILDAGEEFVLPKTEEPPVLRAGNAGSLYFAVNGQHFGPAGVGPSVVRDVALAPEALKANYAVADLTKDDDLARFVAVAEARARQTETSE